MANRKFMEYVNEQRRIGRSDKQIATSLGMSMKHFLKEFGEASKAAEEEPKPENEPEEPVVVLETKPEDDFDWMD